jgi:hypothetical protein
VALASGGTARLNARSVGPTQMIAFEVYVNGEYVCTAGVGELGVVSATLTWVRRAPENSQNGKSFEEELTFDVGGLSKTASVGWLRRELAVGDHVKIKVISAATVDTPRSSQKRDDAADVEASERQYFEYLKKKYGRRPSKSKAPRKKPRKPLTLK